MKMLSHPNTRSDVNVVVVNYGEWKTYLIR